MLDRLRNKYQTKGQFNFSLGEELRSVMEQSGVPNDPGIYLIFSEPDCNGMLVYIGKAGTYRNEFGWGKQGLAGRITNRQDKMPREEYFSREMRKHGWSELSFAWFVTFCDSVKKFPQLVEAKVMQAHFDKYGELPLLNKEY